VNRNHDVCGSEDWRAVVRDAVVPWALGDGDLGDDVLEVGPGFGATTDVFREQVGRLTAVEIDPELAARLRDRLAGTNVEVVEGDATALDFGDDRFSGATCFSMLHHVPSSNLQDRLFAEVARVVRTGGLFVACDSLASEGLAELHEGDTYVPMDPDGLAARLERAGFEQVDVRTNEYGWAARARARGG
jgi:ubiquinone/menaquinone biosynthesis C-methylase UbiE